MADDGSELARESDSVQRTQGTSDQLVNVRISRHFTDGGRKALVHYLNGHIADLTDEIERLDPEVIRSGAEPEYTADKVDRARDALIRRRQAVVQQSADERARADQERAEQQRQRELEGLRKRRSALKLLSAILLTFAPVGTAIMANFLHSGWQWTLFVGFAFCFALGVILMWATRRS